MGVNIIRCREKIDRLSKPKTWWSLWTISALYILYMLIFDAAVFFRSNYELPSKIATSDFYSANLFFVASNIPVTLFTCLFAGHITLALYKMDKLKKR